MGKLYSYSSRQLHNLTSKKPGRRSSSAYPDRRTSPAIVTVSVTLTYPSMQDPPLMFTELASSYPLLPPPRYQRRVPGSGPSRSYCAHQQRFSLGRAAGTGTGHFPNYLVVFGSDTRGRERLPVRNRPSLLLALDKLYTVAVGILDEEDASAAAHGVRLTLEVHTADLF